MDISKTTQPDSSQVNAEDLLAGPVTVTVTEVTAGNAEQPVNIGLVEFPGRAYRPSKSMRRILVAGWGPDASQYAGRRLTLVRNPDIRFGKDVVGGIEIAAMSNLEKPLAVALTVSRGKRRQFKVAPLPDAPQQPEQTGEIPADWRAQADRYNEVDDLRRLWTFAKDAGATEEDLTYIATKAKEATT